MRANDVKKPRRLIQYMLSADPRLQRISLRKLSARVKSMKRSSSRSIHARHSTRSRKQARAPRTMSVPTIAIVVICVTAAAALIAARQPAQRADVAAEVMAAPGVPRNNAQGSALPAVSPIEIESPAPSKPPARLDAKVAQEKPARPARPDPEKVEAPMARPVAAPVKTQVAGATTGNLPASGSLNASVLEPAAQGPAAESTTRSAEPTTKSDVGTPPPVTITGCLEAEEGTFWLKNTSGADAPKSRSWKSAFLRKRSSPIELVDAPNAPRLTRYVGQRVAATGVLTNREMRASSLRIVSPCD